MVPSAIVLMDRLPLTPNGKLDRRALPAPEGRPEAFAYVAARTPMEELLTGIWEEALRLERIGVHDNFFELGGNSLLATRMVAKMRNVLKIEMPLRMLFEEPTIAELAERSEELQRAGKKPVAPPLTARPRLTRKPV
jgi:acyl carrier protein